MNRRWKIFTLVAAATIVADLGSKFWAESTLPTTANGIGLPVSVIQNFWDWRLSYNTGSAFGLFGSLPGGRHLLTIVGLLALGAVFWWTKKTPQQFTRLITALGLVAGGAVGNLYDRILYGKVTDFVVWRYYEHQWPTFNIADVALVVGEGLLLLDLRKLDGKKSEGDDADGSSGKSKPKKKSGKKRRGRR